MICSKCKNEIPDNSIYCPMCGVSTGSVPVPPSPLSSGDDSRYAVTTVSDEEDTVLVD